MKAIYATVTVSVLFVSLAGSLCRADEAPLETLSPYFIVENADPATDQLPLKSTRVDVRISDVIADVLVTQVYRNEGPRPIHARYVYPASTRAAVTAWCCKSACAASTRKFVSVKRRNASSLKRRRAAKTAALLKQQRPNVFSMSVANVMPRDDIRVELHYSELLVPTDGTYEFVYPTVVRPRYSSPSDPDAAEDSNWSKGPYLHEERHRPRLLICRPVSLPAFRCRK